MARLPDLRAWAVDDDNGDCWGQCQHTLEPGQQMLGWIQQDQLRRDGNFTDDAGLIGPIPESDPDLPR